MLEKMLAWVVEAVTTPLTLTWFGFKTLGELVTNPEWFPSGVKTVATPVVTTLAAFATVIIALSLANQGRKLATSATSNPQERATIQQVLLNHLLAIVLLFLGGIIFEIVHALDQYLVAVFLQNVGSDSISYAAMMGENAATLQAESPLLYALTNLVLTVFGIIMNFLYFNRDLMLFTLWVLAPLAAIGWAGESRQGFIVWLTELLSYGLMSTGHAAAIAILAMYSSASGSPFWHVFIVIPSLLLITAFMRTFTVAFLEVAGVFPRKGLGAATGLASLMAIGAGGLSAVGAMASGGYARSYSPISRFGMAGTNTSSFSQNGSSLDSSHGTEFSGAGTGATFGGKVGGMVGAGVGSIIGLGLGPMAGGVARTFGAAGARVGGGIGGTVGATVGVANRFRQNVSGKSLELGSSDGSQGTLFQDPKPTTGEAFKDALGLDKNASVTQATTRLFGTVAGAGLGGLSSTRGAESGAQMGGRLGQWTGSVAEIPVSKAMEVGQRIFSGSQSGATQNDSSMSAVPDFNTRAETIGQEIQELRQSMPSPINQDELFSNNMEARLPSSVTFHGGGKIEKKKYEPPTHKVDKSRYIPASSQSVTSVPQKTVNSSHQNHPKPQQRTGQQKRQNNKETIIKQESNSGERGSGNRPVQNAPNLLDGYRHR
ncbi:MFS transporter [Heliorestis acidaminivorans]|uniref:MFS transporter n=1 Tax=Heliorestis acidaminivorans TaxID=553427 RepID=A0A6I0EPW0_9FIRM|nr:hypothetical protein [Heliorestis acidaminivorans]KAB2951997.1 MFS transporter [Heliorestis acidaminivorans]